MSRKKLILFSFSILIFVIQAAATTENLQTTDINDEKYITTESTRLHVVCPPGYGGKRCEYCEPGYEGNPLEINGTCTPKRGSDCDPRGTEEIMPDGTCKCKEEATGPLCDLCAETSFFSSNGCTECFCMGITRQCTTSSYYREPVVLSFAFDGAQPIAVVTDYEESDAEIEPNRVSVKKNELQLSGFKGINNEVYYYSLPNSFLGKKISSYGGNISYTLRYTSYSEENSSNAYPDVVIKSKNDITVLHYENDKVSTDGYQTTVVPIVENKWRRSNGLYVDREHLLMALADIEAIYIKATYSMTTVESALQRVSMDISSPRNTGSNFRAVEVEQCNCPKSHIGLSCEDCAPGYARSGSGFYLGICERCECSGHSEKCDPDTGVCEDCRHNTVGDNCDACAPGYHGNATHGTPYDCERSDTGGESVTTIQQE